MNLLVICRLLIAARHRLATVLVWSAVFTTPLHGNIVGPRCCGCCRAVGVQADRSASHCCPACSADDDSSDRATSNGWNCRKSCACRAIPAPASEGPKRTVVDSSLIDQLSLWAIPAISLPSVVDGSLPYFKNHGRPKRGLTALACCILLQRLTT